MNKSAPRYIFCNFVDLEKFTGFSLLHLIKGKKHSVTGLCSVHGLKRALIGNINKNKERRSPSDFRRFT